MTEGHEEYQQVIREVLAPTLDYKMKWEGLKDQVEHEIEQAEIGLMAVSDTVSFPERSPIEQYGDEMFYLGMLAELRRFKSIMKKLAPELEEK